MWDQKTDQILTYLRDNHYHTAQSLAERVKVSSKTVRAILKEANAFLVKKEAGYIESKHGKGYRLVITSNSHFDNLFNLHEQPAQLPDNPQTRIPFILMLLLRNKDYIKSDDLERLLFVSRNTITSDLKEVERLLNKYDIRLDRRPNYGIKAMGREFNFRLCIANYIMEQDKFSSRGNVKRETMTKKIAQCVTAFLDETGFSMSDIALQNLIIHIYVAVIRVSEGSYVSLNEDTLTGFDLKKEYEAAGELVNRLNQIFHITFPQVEINYITIHLAGKKIWDNEDKRNENTVISPRINTVVTEIINKANEIFKLDFRDNLELRMSLCQHLLALEIRIKYGLNMKNPLLDEIKTRYAFAYAVAIQVCTVINEHYSTKLKEDEIGYIALTFALALERHRTQVYKKNVLLVCSTGKGSANLLKYRYMEEFSTYINEIHTCDVRTLDKIDFTGIDYVFTTVPIGIKVPVPIMEVQYFLEPTDIANVKRTLKSITANVSVKQFYRQDLFIPSLDCKTKEEVLRFMCGFAAEKVTLPDCFYDSVMKRERLARTEFGNNVAMPHPDEPLSEETFVCVAVLKTPLLWEDHYVQLVFLVSITNNENAELNAFYDATAKFLLSKEYVGRLIKARDYNVLMQSMDEIEKGK